MHPKNKRIGDFCSDILQNIHGFLPEKTYCEHEVICQITILSKFNQTNLVILFKMKYLDFYCVKTQVLAQKHYINKKKSIHPEIV